VTKKSKKKIVTKKGQKKICKKMSRTLSSKKSAGKLCGLKPFLNNPPALSRSLLFPRFFERRKFLLIPNMQMSRPVLIKLLPPKPISLKEIKAKIAT